MKPKLNIVGVLKVFFFLVLNGILEARKRKAVLIKYVAGLLKSPLSQYGKWERQN